jgi:NADH-quinone oxidoreductase subunit C
VETNEQIKGRVENAVPGAKLELVPNESPANQLSLLLDSAHALAVARFLRDDPQLRLDYCSNVTGVDWLDTVLKEKVKVKKTIDGVEKEVEEQVEHERPGYLEAVYHLYSMALKHGPVVIRMRTENRGDKNHLPSLTPVWRGAEFQEREIYDLYGIVFDGHPDLRRILMWDGYPFFPLRKEFPLEGLPSEMPDVAFTKSAPLEGGPFVTQPSTATTKDREPRAHPPEL